MELFNKKRLSIHRLKTGICQLCYTEDENLMPLQLNVCKRCALHFLKKTGNLPLLKKEVTFRNYECDWCGERTKIYYYINPRVCRKCNKKMYKKIRYGYE